MSVSANRAFRLLRQLEYEKISCSEEEKKAARQLLEVCRAAGVEAHPEHFKVPAGRTHSARLTVLEPYYKEYELAPHERCLATPAGGLELEFVYAEDLQPMLLQDVAGKCVLMNGYMRRRDYAALKQAGAAAMLTFTGEITDRRGDTDLCIWKLREDYTDRYGDAFAGNIRAADALEMVRRGARKIRLDIDAERFEGDSQNVCATIPGTQYPDQIISFGSHYDSFHYSTGVHDNITGCVIQAELMRHFAQNPPARTLKFNWFGSEEVGRRGSQSWVDSHREELDRHCLMINVDGAGVVLGRDVIMVMADDAAVEYVKGLMRELGRPVQVTSQVMSSDGVPFTDAGIPSVNLTRNAVPGTAFYHERRDCLRHGYLTAEALDSTLQETLFIAERAANSAVCPIEKKISPEMRAAVDRYLGKNEQW